MAHFNSPNDVVSTFHRARRWALLSALNVFCCLAWVALHFSGRVPEPLAWAPTAGVALTLVFAIAAGGIAHGYWRSTRPYRRYLDRQ